LADEPTGNLDQENGRKVLKLIKELHKEGHTIVLVTHNPEVAQFGSRTIGLIDGKVDINDVQSKNRRESHEYDE